MEAIPQIPMILKALAFAIVGLYGIYEFRRNGIRSQIEFGLIWGALGAALALV